jgi:ATP-dependent RNA helicase RhlE
VPLLEPFACDTTPVPFTSLSLDKRLLEGIRDLGFKDTAPGADGGDPPRARQPRSDRVRRDRDGEDGGVRGADAPVAADHRRARRHAGRRDRTCRRVARAAPKSRVLVLAPTRELAVQIEDEIHGPGVSHQRHQRGRLRRRRDGMQERALKAGVDIIVATPGRLMDHMRQQNADLSAIELLVLDEADRMMDMGFWPDVRRIISTLPGVRQTLLFSATMPDDVVRDALEITREAKYIQVGQRSAPAKSITHRIENLGANDKVDWLIDHLKKPEGPVLIFTRTKVGADRLARRLAAAGREVHGAPRRPQPGSAPHRGRRVQGGQVQGAGAHRHRGARPRHRRDPYGHQLRSTRLSRRLRAPRGPHRPRGCRRQAITLVSPEERRALAFLAKAVGLQLE